MYASVLADGPALTLDGHAVLFATVQWRSKTAVVALDVTNGEILRASPEGAPSDAAALDPSSSWPFGRIQQWVRLGAGERSECALSSLCEADDIA